MSEKVCYHHKSKWHKIRRRLAAGIIVFLLIVLIVILIVWAILRPTKPTFVLQDITVYAFNASFPNFFTSNFQVTLSSRNPNDNIGVYYDRLDAYITYRNQQITYRTSIPPSYQGHQEVDVWSPFVYGTNVPVAPYNFVALTQDQANGNVLATVKIDGRVRWKVGSVTTGPYHIHVGCPAVIPFGPRSTGIVVGDNAVKYQMAQRCSVSV